MQMLNIKGLALEYGLPYNPPVIPKLAMVMYTIAQYGLTVPFIALGISVILLGLYYGYEEIFDFIEKRKNNEGINLFFVEDDENIAELLEATLSLNGYRSKGF